MAAETLKDVTVSVGAQDLSSLVKGVRLPVSYDVKSKTGMGDAAETNAAGTKRWEVSIDWYGDFAASSVYATIQPLLGTSAECIITPKDTTTSATNPQWTGNVIISEFPFIDATYGEMHEFSTTWPCNGDYTIAVA